MENSLNWQKCTRTGLKDIFYVQFLDLKLTDECIKAVLSYCASFEN